MTRSAPHLKGSNSTVWNPHSRTKSALILPYVSFQNLYFVPRMGLSALNRFCQDSQIRLTARVNGKSKIENRRIGLSVSHARVLEEVAKRQFPRKTVVLKKWRAPLKALLNEFTPSNNLAWRVGDRSELFLCFLLKVSQIKKSGNL